MALVANIENAFLQISLAERDRDALRFLWYVTTPKIGQPLSATEVLRMTREPFGAACSPFLLAATIRYHFRMISDKYPDTCRLLSESFYVDDLATSVSTVQEAKRLWKESVDILEDCGMRLRKWRTNDELLRGMFRDLYNGDDSIRQTETKVLGPIWDTDSDALRISLKSVLEFLHTAHDTKRTVLEATVRVFDPLGFLAPFAITAKVMFQRLWQKGILWGEVLQPDILEDWHTWCRELPKANDLCIPRGIKYTGPPRHQTLHVFCDASPQAYGAVIYVRSIQESSLCTVRLVGAKSRVASLKTVSLPRPELLGALLEARLLYYITKCFGTNLSTTLWTDSTILINWIKGDTNRYKPFVATRTTEIQNRTNPSDWRHCPGKENPADLLTRGISIDSLQNRADWWEGPLWLHEDEAYWPRHMELIGFQDEEVNATVVLSAPSVSTCPVLELAIFSSLNKVIRTTALIYRFFSNSSQGENKIAGPLTASEIEQAEKYWIRQVQAESFHDELRAISSSQPVKPTSKLRDFHLFLDEAGLLRLKGQLQRSEENEEGVKMDPPRPTSSEEGVAQLSVVQTTACTTSSPSDSSTPTGENNQIASIRAMSYISDDKHRSQSQYQPTKQLNPHLVPQRASNHRQAQSKTPPLRKQRPANARVSSRSSGQLRNFRQAGVHDHDCEGARGMYMDSSRHTIVPDHAPPLGTATDSHIYDV
ncbi:uncharacterized protein LOC135395776 [Ornithodoros turicata]|uniref:uncharacterized protein LOC135395776 n=1 Tax=Ornithodoros turicata TaxID=34597 RepID=UPI0031392C8E